MVSVKTDFENIKSQCGHHYYNSETGITWCTIGKKDKKCTPENCKFDLEVCE